MDNPFTLVVFDWEGTLADSIGQILNTISMEATNLGFGDLDIDKARSLVDLGLVKALPLLYPHLSLDQQEHLLHAIQMSLANKTSEICLIPGAKAFIELLERHSISMAVASNKGQHSLQKAIATCGLDNYLKITRSAGQVPPKPHPQMLQEILDIFQIDAEKTLMIGDSTADMEMASTLGVTALGFDYYHLQEDALKACGAKQVFDNYHQISTYLKLI